MAEQILRANGVDLCAETFGDPGDPAILLIGGAASSMLMWREEFCRALADAGRHVIRYDLRDTGRSVNYPVGKPGYDYDDLVGDALGLLDALDIAAAHLVGISMSGGIVIRAARRAPERVLSVTLMATSPGGDDLPPMSPEFLEGVREAGQREVDWSDRDAAIDELLAAIRLYAGYPANFDEGGWRAELAREVDRTENIAASQVNHFVMDIDDSDDDRIEPIGVPALVIHGDSDPVFPLGHAEAMAAGIPDSKLVVLPGTSHLILADSDPVVVPALIEHTAG